MGYLSAQAQVISLDEFKTAALKHNHKIKEAHFKLKSAEEKQKETRTNFFPKVNAGFTSVRLNKDLIDIQIPELKLPVSQGGAVIPNQFAVLPGMPVQAIKEIDFGYLNAVLPVYMGGQIRNGNKLTKMLIDINSTALQLTEDQTILQTEKLYWQIVSFNEKCKTLDSYEKLLHQLNTDVSNSFEAGLINKSDVLKVQLEQNKLSAQKLQLNNAIKILTMTLCQFTGITYNKQIRLNGKLQELATPQQLYTTPEEAVNRRKEYQLLQKGVEVAQLQHKLTKGSLMPSLALGVNNFHLKMDNNDKMYTATYLTLSVPLSNWWAGSHQLKQSKYQTSIAKNNLDEKAQLMVLQINNSFQNLTLVHKQINVANSGLETAEENLKVVTNNFKAGIANTSDLLEAQAEHQKAQDNLIDVKTKYILQKNDYLFSVSNLSR
jgi:outer membrane protein TolC